MIDYIISTIVTIAIAIYAIDFVIKYVKPKIRGGRK